MFRWELGFRVLGFKCVCQGGWQKAGREGGRQGGQEAQAAASGVLVPVTPQGDAQEMLLLLLLW